MNSRLTKHILAEARHQQEHPEDEVEFSSSASFDERRGRNKVAIKAPTLGSDSEGTQNHCQFLILLMILFVPILYRNMLGYFLRLSHLILLECHKYSFRAFLCIYSPNLSNSLRPQVLSFPLSSFNQAITRFGSQTACVSHRRRS